jgi:hypothetical protein
MLTYADVRRDNVKQNAYCKIAYDLYKKFREGGGFTRLSVLFLISV